MQGADSTNNAEVIKDADEGGEQDADKKAAQGEGGGEGAGEGVEGAADSTNGNAESKPDMRSAAQNCGHFSRLVLVLKVGCVLQPIR